MRELTKAEEEIMQVLWEIDGGFVKDVIARLPDPKPAYNTVSTIVRILEKKEYVGHEAYGKTHRYFPLVPREEYSRRALGKVMSNYFGGSVKQLMSFFVKEEDISIGELEELLETIRKDTNTLPDDDQ